MRNSTMRVAAAVAVAVALAAVGCSSDDGTGGGSGGAGARSERPERTTTTVSPGAVEVYTQAGLDPRETACVAASGVEGELTVTPGETLQDPIVLEAGTTRIEVPPELRTGAELERLLLGALAASCAPPSSLDRLASIDGTASDELVVSDELPPYLERRRGAGATPEELACLDAGFRAAPARLSSLAASPEMVELQCVGVDRRAQWHRTALDLALAGAGATPEERACLSLSVLDQVALSEILSRDVAATNDAEVTEGGGAPSPDDPVCADGARLGALAVELLADGVDPSVVFDPSVVPGG